MADKAKSRISASVLMDTIKTKMVGNLLSIPKDIGDKWVYAEIEVNASANLLSTANDFLVSGVALATGDKFVWIALKNTSGTSTDGICFSLNGGTAAYNLADGIFLGAGEMICLKINHVTLENLHAASVTMSATYGFPSSANSDAVTVQVAAIVDDADYVP